MRKRVYMYQLKSFLVKMRNNWKIVVIIAIACILAMLEGVNCYRYYRVKNYVTHEASLIWIESSGDKDHLCQYGPNGRETLLEDRYEFRDFICSKDNKRLLSFIGEWEWFTIAEYDIENRELHTILELEEIDAFLDENGYEKSSTGREGSCVRYYDDERKISFIYDTYLMGYSQEGLEVIYTTKRFSIYGYSWLEDGVSLLICDADGLIKYNTVTGKKEMVAEKIRAFDLSPNNKFIIMADNDYVTWKYDLETGKVKKIFSVSAANGLYPILRISEDNRYLLYENNVTDSLGMGSYRHYIYIIDVENGKKRLVKKWKYGIPIITGVAWRN